MNDSSDVGIGRGGRRWQIVLLSLLLTSALVWILRAGGLPLVPPAGTLDHANGPALAWFVLGLAFHVLVRYARCHLLIAPLAEVPFRKTMTINAISMAFITFLPLRLGEFARPAMLREKGHLSFGAVTGTVAAERILDGVVYSVMLLLGLAAATPRDPLPDHIGSLPVAASLVPQAARAVALGFGLAFVVLVSFYRFRSQARRATELVIGVVSKPLAQRIAGIVERMSDGLKFLVNLRYSLPYLGLTIVAILAHVVAIEMLAEAVGIPELTFVQATVVLGVLAIGFAMPNAPGFFGTIQLALYAGLASYVAPEKVSHEGAALVFVFYVTYLAVIVVFALLAVVVEYFIAAGQQGAPNEQ